MRIVFNLFLIYFVDVNYLFCKYWCSYVDCKLVCTDEADHQLSPYVSAIQPTFSVHLISAHQVDCTFRITSYFESRLLWCVPPSWLLFLPGISPSIHHPPCAYFSIIHHPLSNSTVHYVLCNEIAMFLIYCVDAIVVWQLLVCLCCTEGYIIVPCHFVRETVCISSAQSCLGCLGIVCCFVVLLAYTDKT